MTGVSLYADRLYSPWNTRVLVLMIDDWWWKLWWSWFFDEHGTSFPAFPLWASWWEGWKVHVNCRQCAIDCCRCGIVKSRNAWLRDVLLLMLSQGHSSLHTRVARTPSSLYPDFLCLLPRLGFSLSRGLYPHPDPRLTTYSPGYDLIISPPILPPHLSLSPRKFCGPGVTAWD